MVVSDLEDAQGAAALSDLAADVQPDDGATWGGRRSRCG